MILKLGMYHWKIKLYKVYINNDPGLTLTYFTARSNWVICTLNGENCYKSHLIEQNLRKRTILTE